VNTRPWTPAKASIEPDDITLAMIEPTGDARYDLGAALLGMHRAGAAACKVAAVTPMLGESGFIKSIAATREMLADTMINSISKSTSGANYAALLTRDLFDDAEQGALELFRHAVAKGVVPPIAAERVGAVYGVPSRELGKYRGLASDPRANPSALADTADRVLLSYVEKVVGEELAEPVSKTTPTAVRDRIAPTRVSDLFAQGQAGGGVDPDDPRTPYYDARDARGRFARTEGAQTRPAVATESGGGRARTPTATAPPVALAEPGAQLATVAALRARFGLGSQAAPEVGTTPAEAVTAEQQRTAEAEQAAEQFRQRQQRARAARAARSRRKRRQQQQQPQATAQIAAARPKARPAPKMKAQLSPAFVTALRGNDPVPEPPVPGVKHKLLQPVPDNTGYVFESTDKNYSYAIPKAQLAEFMKDWGASPGGLFLQHNIRSLAGGNPALAANEDDVGTGGMDSFESINEAIAAARGIEHENAPKVFKRLEPTDAGYQGDQVGRPFQEWMNLQKQLFANELEAQGLPHDVEHIQEMPDRSGEGWTLVRWDLTGLLDEIPSVVEFHFASPRVTDIGEGRHQEQVMDPNQAWREVTQTDEIAERFPNSERVYWSTHEAADGTPFAVVHEIRYFVPVTQEDVDQTVDRVDQRSGRHPFGRRFSKALTMVETATLRDRVADEPRDAQGRWARQAGVAQVLEHMRSAPPVAAPVEEAPVDQQAAERRQQRLAQAKRAREARRRRQRKQTKPAAQQVQTAPARGQITAQLSPAGQKARRQTAKLRAALLDPNQYETPAGVSDWDDGGGAETVPFNSLDLEDGYYSAVGLDFFKSIAQDNGWTGDGLPDIVHIHQSRDITDLTDEEAQGKKASLNLALAYLDQQLDQDGSILKLHSRWPNVEALDIIRQLREERATLAQDDIGLVNNREMDPDGTQIERHVNVTAAKPVILIDFSDDELGADQPFDLVKVTETTHYEKLEAEPEDSKGPLGGRLLTGEYILNFPVVRYRAIPASPNTWDQG
jgi:hypothetical protein